MLFKLNLFSILSFLILVNCISCSVSSIQELTDQSWDQIQRGEWLIGFFDEETKDSINLKEDWPVFATQCQEQGIKTGYILSHNNPGLSVRFIVTGSPKAFYVRNGVAHPILDARRQTLIDLIKEKRWSKLKPVSFMKNPFSVQMSLLAHMFMFTVRIYNYEHEIVQSMVPIPAATDIVFGITFITAGTFIGLLLTVVISIVQVLLTSKSREETDEDREETVEDDESDEQTGKSAENVSVKKRK